MPLALGSQLESLGGLQFLRGDATPVPCPGRVTVVELWAKWCPPCRAMFPHLAALQKKHASRGLLIVGIAIDDDGSLVQFVQQQGDNMAYTVAVDKGGSAGALMQRAGVGGIPHSFVADRASKLVYSGHPGEPRFEQAIEAALAAAPPQEREALPLVTSSPDELRALRVPALKALLQERGVSTAGAAEKEDLVQLILARCSSTVYYR